MTSSELFLRSAAPDEVEINTAEALRYMGINKHFRAEDFDSLFENCLDSFLTSVSYKAVVAPLELSLNEGEKSVGTPFGRLKSVCLFENLKGSESGFVFASTLGVAVDRLILSRSRTSPAEAVVIDAIASAAVEAFSDAVNAEFAAGKENRHRYSPGYGDLPLGVQPLILDYLDAYRRLGITLSPEMFMTPTKSVTAFFGVRK